MTIRPEPFDEIARAAHADALNHVSSRVQAQLQQRRRAALSDRASARPLWPALALGGAAAVALAIGLRFARDPADAPTTPDIATTSNSTQTIGTPTAHETAPAIATADDTNDAPVIDRTPREAIAANEPTDATADTTLADIEALLANNDLADSGNDDTTLLAANDDALLADLDENPDLYLWLGSDESLADTTELL